MKVRRMEFLLLVALASSALAMQIREDSLSSQASASATDAPAIVCSQPAATSRSAKNNPVIEASCQGMQDSHAVQGTQRRPAIMPRPGRLQV